MERREEVKVKSGAEYDHLFPRAMLTTITKKEGATVADTIQFIPQVVRDTLFHTSKVANVLKGKTVRESCENIWHFVYDHIAYKKDEDGKEQVRSPARAWHDRTNIQGVDCDCYTVFISSILSNLKIKHKLRITKYKEDRFQHIYPIVPVNDGSYITIDCVVKQFDYEEPYSEKKDTNMDLEYLNGVFDTTQYKNTDALDLVGIYDDREAMAELGRIFRRKASGGGGASANNSSQGGGKKKGKLREVLKKGLHITNRLNPATAVLRAGILASAKLNIMKISQRLKYAYLTDEEAQKRGIDMQKFAKLKNVRDKLDKIFYGAGGKPENLKKAILSGRGNKDKDVSGLNYAYDGMEGLDGDTAISRLLGNDLYASELSEVINGLGELGEPATAATIAAATGVIGAIAGLLKGIGNIFPKKDKASKEFETGGGGNANEGGGNSSGGNDEGGGSNEDANVTTKSRSSSSSNSSSSSGGGGSGSGSSDKDSSDDGGSNAKSKSGGEDNGNKTDGFWNKNKKWLKPVAIGVGGIGLLFAGYKIVSTKSTPAKSNLSGIPKSRKKPKRKSKHKNKPSIQSNKPKKEAVALM